MTTCPKCGHTSEPPPEPGCPCPWPGGWTVEPENVSQGYAHWAMPTVNSNGKSASMMYSAARGTWTVCPIYAPIINITEAQAQEIFRLILAMQAVVKP